METTDGGQKKRAARIAKVARFFPFLYCCILMIWDDRNLQNDPRIRHRYSFLSACFIIWYYRTTSTFILFLVTWNDCALLPGYSFLTSIFKKRFLRVKMAASERSVWANFILELQDWGKNVSKIYFSLSLSLRLREIRIIKARVTKKGIVRGNR